MKDQDNKSVEHNEDQDSVLLHKTDNYLQAQLIVSALEEANIPCLAKRLGSKLGSMQQGGFSHSLMDGAKPAEIWVNPDDLDKAKDILESIIANSDEQEIQENDNE